MHRCPIREVDAQLVRRVGRGVADGLAEPEACVQQRREGIDVRTHDQDVARLQRRITLQEVDEHITHHIDLAGCAVAGMDLQAPVHDRYAAGRPIRGRR